MNNNAVSTALRRRKAENTRRLQISKIIIIVGAVATASTFLSSALIARMSKKLDDKAAIEMEKNIEEYNSRIEKLRNIGNDLAHVNSQTIIQMYYRLHACQLEAFGLTEQEVKIATRAITGESSSSIAKHMLISDSTVRHYLGAVYKKTGTSNCRELRDLIRARIQQKSETQENNS